MLDRTEITQKAHGLHFGWPSQVRGQGHNPLIRNISKRLTDRTFDPREDSSKVVMEIRLIPWDLTSDDLEGLKSWSYFLTPNMWKMATVTMLDITEVVDTGHRLYFGWPCGVKGQGHNPLTQNISKTVTDTRLDPREHLHVGPTGFRLTLDDPEGQKSRSNFLTSNM